MAAAVILLVVSGGVLWLVAGGAHRQTAHLPATVHTGTPSKATATSTRIAGPSTSTSAPIPATGATRLPAVSATSVPTLAPSPIPATATPQLVTIFSDPLTGNANGWPVQKGCSFGSTGYDVDGGSQCLAPVTAGDTVNISVQMMNGGLTFGGAGIGFRIPSGQLSQQYSFYIFSTGACLAEDQSSHTTFFDNQSCAVVNQGAHATNTLAINQNGAQMDFYVNGSLVGTGDDATLSGGGIALEAHSIGAPVVFTNFVLTSWQ